MSLDHPVPAPAKGKLPPRERSIVFYSETHQDWHHLQPLIDFLVEPLARTVCHVTSERAVPLRDPAGRILKWFGSNTDIEDFVVAERKLKVQLERLQLLDRTTHAIGSHFKPVAQTAWRIDLPPCVSAPAAAPRAMPGKGKGETLPQLRSARPGGRRNLPAEGLSQHPSGPPSSRQHPH